tara:strand:+ start:8835 stop:10355 length:1521 start_codon:yes stop_codon:yes gene_type:complete
MRNADKYVIIKLIGKGGYGNVYKVKPKGFHNLYAMKKINIISSSSLDNKNLITEIKILKYTDCPYIVKLHDILLLRSHICLITFYANKGDLHNEIKRLKKTYKCFDELKVWNYFIQISLGIKYLHDNNIIHRDIKTSNIFIHKENDGTEIIKIGDFGISKIIKISTNMSNTIIGTPLYMSPELYKRESYDKKIDIWALGCIVFEMVELIPPFSANTIEKLSRKVKQGKFRKPICNYTTDISKIIPKLIEINVDKRYSIDDVLSNEDVKKHMYLVPYPEINYEVDKKIYMSVKTPRGISGWMSLASKDFDLNTISKKKRVLPTNAPSMLRRCSKKPDFISKNKLPTIKKKSPKKKLPEIKKKSPKKKLPEINIKKNNIKSKYNQSYYRQFLAKKNVKQSIKNNKNINNDRSDIHSVMDKRRIIKNENIGTRKNENKIKTKMNENTYKRIINHDFKSYVSPYFQRLPRLQENKNIQYLKKLENESKRFHKKRLQRKKEILIKIGSKHI